jgi:hypothetical protein
VLTFRAILIVLLSSVTLVHLASAEAQPPASQPELVERQQQILTRLEELEARLAKLATTLAETEPDKAERLTEALRTSGKGQFAARLREITLALRQGAWGEAEHEQAKLLNDFDALLSVLSEARSDLDELQAQRERLEQRRETLNRLFDQQMELRIQLGQRDAAEEMNAKLLELAENLDRLAERQQQTAESGDADTQRDLQAVAQATTEAIAAQAQAAPTTEQQEALQTAKSATQAAAQSMQRALEAIQNSADHAEGEPQNPAPSAHPEQQQAASNLRAAAEALRQAGTEEPPESDLRRIERLQRDLQSQADQLQQQMRPNQASQAPPPGSQQAGKAAEHMQQAADALSEEDSPAAQGEQDAALEQLQRALDQLDDALRQVRREERTEMLAGIETRLRAIIAAEQQARENVVVAVQRLEQDELPELDNAQQLHGNALEDGEKLHRLLLSEGTAVVLPNLLSYCLDDMRRAAEKLSAEALDPQLVQDFDAILVQLDQLLGAIAQQREKDRKQNDSQQGEGNQPSENQPLMQRSGELKLLRTAQLTLNDRSQELDQKPANLALGSMLATRQEELAALILRLIETE